MDHPWTQMWKWTLCVLLCGMSVGRGSATLHYMVAIPAVLESGAETKFCASLLQPNEYLLMTVTLVSQNSSVTLLEKTSSTELNECFQFQDTVVALQALSLYSSLVFSPEGSSTVTVQSPSGPLTFGVTPDNKLLYQEKILQGEAGKYSLEVKGTGCASVQFNIPTFTDATTLRVKVEPEADCRGPSHKPRLNIQLQSL
ncbi:alpha-2-macroglobulin-like protein 1 [Xiphophorus hellerii]|uniref:alpha-2-macroglobulin-like protein 1 n=1 Tax=Xiphophorus hellerii TaxID=8084 RepID=UPI0013B466A1|nr:alpha-2-macroglobulin-like protein 1 [Xiphophorus hellerii]